MEQLYLSTSVNNHQMINLKTKTLSDICAQVYLQKKKRKWQGRSKKANSLGVLLKSLGV